MQSLWPNKGMRYQTAAPAAIEMTGGEQILDFIHVDDISRFLIYVIQNHCSFCMLEKNGEDFHLGTV